MNLKAIRKRIVLGVGLSMLFILVSAGNVASGKWTRIPALLFAVAGIVFAFAVAFMSDGSGGQARAANSQARGRPILRQALLFIGAAVAFLLLMKALDAFHVDWRHWIAMRGQIHGLQ
jgi:hypothetical protein